MNKEICSGVGTALQGFYKVAVVNAETKEVVWQQDEWQKNLILNQGMDDIYTYSIVTLMTYGVAGSGTRPNSIDGGTSEITQSGATVYLNVNTGLSDFTSSTSTYAARVQVGDVLKYANNSESMVSAVDVGGFNLTVSPSYTFTSGQTFVIWKTSQAGLESEIKRTNTYLVGAGNSETTTAGNVRTHRRTYDFTAEVGSVTYNEVGVARLSSGATNVFNRILLASPVTVDATFQLRLIYDLQTTWTPATPLYNTASIGGWPVAPSTNTIGSESLQVFLTSIVAVADGLSTLTNAIMDPYLTSNVKMWASPSSTVLSAFGSAANRTTNGAVTAADVTKAAYVAGSYYCDKTGTLTVGQINRTDIRSIGFGKGTTAYDATNQAYAYVFDQPQTKDSTQTLSFTFRTTWARVLA